MLRLRIWERFEHRLTIYLTTVAILLSLMYILQVIPVHVSSDKNIAYNSTRGTSGIEDVTEASGVYTVMGARTGTAYCKRPHVPLFDLHWTRYVALAVQPILGEKGIMLWGLCRQYYPERDGHIYVHCNTYIMAWYKHCYCI